MNKNLIVTSVKGWDKEKWLRFRADGIGASSVGTIFGYNQYKSALELWYEMLTLEPKYSVENIAQFMGHYHENAVAELREYWDGTEAGMIKNYREGKIVCRNRRIDAYVQNPKYPWLFASLDRIINKGERGEEGALEIKTISSYEAKKWETGIPPSNIMQVMTQMLVCEFTYGEIAAMRDGRQLDVWQFEYNPIIGDQIIIRTKEFWDSVLKGRVLMTRKYEAVKSFNMKLADELQAELETLEPPPDNTEAYAKFLKDKYNRSLAQVGLVTGTEADYLIAEEHKRLKSKIKDLETEMRLCENQLKNRIKEGTALDFGDKGKVNWDGEPRKFINKIK
jgi:putative phage-type endonuclease